MTVRYLHCTYLLTYLLCKIMYIIQISATQLTKQFVTLTAARTSLQLRWTAIRGGSRRSSWGQISWSWDGSHPEWSRGGLGTESRRRWSIFLLKYTTWNLRPCENARHNLKPLMAFLSQCTPALRCFSTMFGILGAWPLCPQNPPLTAIRPQFDCVTTRLENTSF